MSWKKFKNEEHIYPKAAAFGIGSIFETYHPKTEKSLYLKVVYVTTDLCNFNLVECDNKGNFLSTRKRGTSKTEIIDFITKNDWRLYKQHFGKRELIPKVKGSSPSKKEKNYPKETSKL